MLYSFFRLIYPASEFYVPTFWNTVCSVFIGGLSWKNNRNEIVGVFIWEEVWLENSVSQSEEGVMGRGGVRLDKQAVEGKDP